MAAGTLAPWVTRSLADMTLSVCNMDIIVFLEKCFSINYNVSELKNHAIHILSKTSNIRHILVGNKKVNDSDIVGASSVAAASTTSLFST